MKVVFGRRAEQDLLAQIDWLAERTPAAARKASAQIEAALQLLGDFPLAAPLADSKHHELAIGFGRDGFVLRYRVLPDRIVVVRLFHGRQSRRPKRQDPTASRS